MSSAVPLPSQPALQFPRVPGTESGYRLSAVHRFFESTDPYTDLPRNTGGSVSGAGRSPSAASALPQTPAAALDEVIRQARLQAYFPAQRGGYRPEAVDVAVTRRLDHLALQAHRSRMAQGDRAYAVEVDALRLEIMGRLQRPEQRRFSPPSHARTRGYRSEDVDHLCDRLLAFLSDPTRARSITAADVRLVRFNTEEHRRTGYEPTQVDAFLDDVAGQLLLISYDLTVRLGAEEEEAAEAALLTSAVHMPRRAKAL